MIVSFGYKYGSIRREFPDIQVEDVRRVPNPHRRYPTLTGRDPEVRAWLVAQPGVLARVKRIVDWCRMTGVDTVAIGCHGGRHRSVVIATLVAEQIGTTVIHRDVDRYVDQASDQGVG